MDRGFLVLAAQQARLRIGFLQLGGVIVELAGVGGAEQRVVDDGDILDAAHGALEQEALALGEAPGPAALDFIGQRVEPPRDIIGGGVGGGDIAGDFRVQHAGDRRLLDHLAVIAAVQIVQRAANEAGILHQRQQVAAAAVSRRRPA